MINIHSDSPDNKATNEVVKAPQQVNNGPTPPAHPCHECKKWAENKLTIVRGLGRSCALDSADEVKQYIVPYLI